MSKKEIRKFILSDDINNCNITDVINEIILINKEDDKNNKKKKNFKRIPINIYLNTYGGDVYSGLALYDIIKSSKTPIYTYAIGSVMSIGLIIYLAGKKRFTSKNATFMYHEISTFAFSKAEFIEDQLKEVKRLQKVLDSIITSNTLLKQKFLNKIKKSGKDYFINSKKAIKYNISNNKI